MSPKWSTIVSALGEVCRAISRAGRTNCKQSPATLRLTNGMFCALQGHRRRPYYTPVGDTSHQTPRQCSNVKLAADSSLIRRFSESLPFVTIRPPRWCGQDKGRDLFPNATNRTPPAITCCSRTKSHPGARRLESAVWLCRPWKALVLLGASSG